MNNENMKEVYFGVYCLSCKHYEETEEGEHCRACLDVPARQYSHKPERYEEGPNRNLDD